LHIGQNRANNFQFLAGSLTRIGTYKESSSLNACLGELGLRGTLHLCPPHFYFSGEFGILTGIGSRDLRVSGSVAEFVPLEEGWTSNNDARLNEEVASIQDRRKNHSVCFAGIAYKFEFGFAKHFGKLECKLSAGYEGLLFHDLTLFFVPRADGQLIDRTSNLGFAGPFVGVTVSLPF
jgi:hypothetical protein